MKTTLKILTVATIIFTAGTSFAQDTEPLNETEPKRERKVRPLRFGAKLGNPNLIGGNVEYVSPLLNNKLAVSFDYSILKSDWLGLEEDSSNEESGLIENSYIDFTYMGLLNINIP